MTRLTPLRSVSALGGAAACFLAAQIASAEPFTIVVMPDTQSEATNTPQVKFPALTQWIADNKTPRNIQFVAHVGDLVNWETPNSTPPQFQYVNADKAMHTLELVGLPYSVDVGNHDTRRWAASTRTERPATAADRPAPATSTRTSGTRRP